MLVAFEELSRQRVAGKEFPTVTSASAGLTSTEGAAFVLLMVSSARGTGHGIGPLSTIPLCGSREEG